MEEKVQLSNYNRPDKYCIFIPWTTMGGLSDNQYVGTFVWQAVSPTLEAKATRQVREFLANRYRYNPADERADQHVRVGQDQRDHEQHRRRSADRADLHRRGHARDRRRRHHEHHVRQRAGAHAGNRRAHGARRQAARDSRCSFCSRVWRRLSPAAPSASACRTGWCGCSAPARFSPSCSTTRAGVSDIHLVLSLHLVVICSAILMIVGRDQRPAAGDQGVEARSDRSVEVRIVRIPGVGICQLELSLTRYRELRNHKWPNRVSKTVVISLASRCPASAPRAAFSAATTRWPTPEPARSVFP